MRFIHGCLALATILACASAIVAPPAAAANFPLKAAPVAGSWTGFYAGVHGGWGWADTQVKSELGGTPVFPVDEGFNRGPLAGGQIGVNWQSGNLVYGAEIDASWTYFTGGFTLDQTIPSPTARNLIDFRAMGTATGRVGYAMNSWLFYAKGGAAWASVKLDIDEVAAPVPVERNIFGPTAGAGLEVAFLRTVSAKVEYDFNYFLPDYIDVFPHGGPAGVYHFVHVVKAGINVRFGGEAPLPRQYSTPN
jgi:opacity protein-like surface antigen